MIDAILTHSEYVHDLVGSYCNEHFDEASVNQPLTHNHNRANLYERLTFEEDFERMRNVVPAEYRTLSNYVSAEGHVMFPGEGATRLTQIHQHPEVMLNIRLFETTESLSWSIGMSEIQREVQIRTKLYAARKSRLQRKLDSDDDLLVSLRTFTLG